MPDPQPTAELDASFSDDKAVATEWAQARDVLARADIYWVTTVRPDGRPHVTPLIGVWQDDALHFCTGADERKAKNLARNAHCVLTTGTNTMAAGLDLVVEGEAVRVTDDARLQRLADAWVEKYGEDWRFQVADGEFRHDAGGALVFAVAPSVAFGFAKGDPFGQTRWRFDR